MTASDIAKISCRQLADYDAHRPGRIFGDPSFRLTLDEAYAIQIQTAALRVARGEEMCIRDRASTFGGNRSPPTASSTNMGPQLALLPRPPANARAAPAIRAPWIALNPTGPAPNTTTSEPGSTGARFSAIPSPQADTHESLSLIHI